MKYIIGIFLIVLSVLFAACDLDSSMNLNESNMSNATNMTNESMIVDVNDTDVMTDDMDNMSDTSTDEEVEVNLETQVSSEFDGVFTEGDLIQLKEDLANDPDGDALRYTYSQPLSESGVWQTAVGDAGIYDVTITASDGKLISTKTVTIQVLALNSKPMISNFADFTIKEGETLELNPSVTDADGDDVTLTYSGFVTSESYTVSYNDAGTHTITLVASDGTAVTTKDITVTVENVNRKPIVSDFESIEDEVVEEKTITMTIGAEDPDGDDVTITFAEPLDENGEWVTQVGDAGEHTLTAFISDGTDTVEKSATITIVPKNNPPKIANFDDVAVYEGQTIELSPVVTDADGDEVTFTYSGYMTTNTKQTGFEDKGVYSVTLTATDGQVSTTKTIEVEVIDKNRAPVFNNNLFE